LQPAIPTALPHPFRRARVLDAIGQALGDAKPLLDRRQQQYSGFRGHQAAIKPHMHRLARDRWQTGQNPRTFVDAGRELRWLRLIRGFGRTSGPHGHVGLRPERGYGRWRVALIDARSAKITGDRKPMRVGAARLPRHDR
jgi:hypothetical protein